MIGIIIILVIFICYFVGIGTLVISNRELERAYVIEELASAFVGGMREYYEHLDIEGKEAEYFKAGMEIAVIILMKEIDRLELKD